MMSINPQEIESFLQSEEFFDYSTPEGLQSTKPRELIADNGKKSEASTSDYLVAFSTRSQSYCVGYVDIVNSTKISASLSAEKLTKYYETFLNSMSKIIGKFDGQVIKNIGDCLLFYFPKSLNSSETGIRNCLDCGLAMSQAYEVINSEMVSKRLPSLSYRISADFGNVVLMNTSVSQSVDLIGSPVNSCSKINQYANKNEFVIGEDLQKNAKSLTGYGYLKIRTCDIGSRYSYPVYRVERSYR